MLIPSVSPSSSVIYRATVIGAGPSGLACIGNLLDLLPSTDQILWIDPEFRGGRLASYPAVPSNTKVCLFTKFAEECKSFEAEKNSETFRKLRDEFEGQKGCKLKWAGSLCQELTDTVIKKENISSVKGLVSELNYSQDSKLWTVKTSNGHESFKSHFVFLTTGSKPKSLPLPTATESIHLDDALNPEILQQKVDPADRIAVYGSSHSAMLVLMNLLAIKNNGPSLILNFYRQPAKFASFPDPINCPDRILHDNTGLKGDVAEWVRTWINLTEEELDAKFAGKLKRIRTTNNHVDIPVDKNIFAVGYERNSLPKISYNNTIISPESIDYTPSGQLTSTVAASTSLLNGLYGFGIAFPERVKDLDGSDEAAVGLWKFMRHVKKSLKTLSFY